MSEEKKVKFCPPAEGFKTLGADNRICDYCGEPCNGFKQHAVDADLCSSQCTNNEIARRRIINHWGS